MKPTVIDPKTTTRAAAFDLWMNAPNPMVTFFKTLPQPFLFCDALLAGHGAADMFLVNIFFCDSNIVHRLFLQCCLVSQLNSENTAFGFFFAPIPPA